MAAEPIGRRGGWLSNWFRGWGFSQWGRNAFLVFLGFTALFGGLDQVDTAVTTVKVGEPYDDGALDVTVSRASVRSTVMAGDTVLAPPRPGFRYLGIVAKVANNSQHDVPLDQELDLRGLAGAEQVGVFRLADGSPSTRLGPGLSDEMAFLWRVPEDALHAAGTATIRIWDKKYSELMVAYGKAWIDSLTDYGEVTVPVEFRT